MPRVLHVSYSMGIGGAERALYQLIRGQAITGALPALALLSGKQGLYARLAGDLGLSVFDLAQSSAFDRSVTGRFLEIARAHDCVHFQTQTPVLMWALGRDGGTPWVYTHRAGELRVGWKRRLMHHLAGRLIGRYAHAVSGNTEHAATCARQTYRLPHEDVSVTYNGIDFSLLHPRRSKTEVLAELGEDPSLPVWRIGTTANLRGWKRTDLLIRAVAALDESPIMCYVIGDGPARTSLERLAGQLGVRDRVRFLGLQECVGDYLQLLDAFALLSGQAESFGNSAVEAMGLGIPTVVMADGGGLVEHFPPQQRDFPSDLDELVQRLEGWIRQPDKAKEAARKCRQHVQRKYTLEKMVSRYDELYSSAIEAFENA